MFFDEITLRKNSWHWKLQKFSLGELAWKEFPMNFCPYFWTAMVASVLLTPFAAIVRLIVLLVNFIAGLFENSVALYRKRLYDKRAQEGLLLIRFIRYQELKDWIPVDHPQRDLILLEANVLCTHYGLGVTSLYFTNYKKGNILLNNNYDLNSIKDLYKTFSTVGELIRKRDAELRRVETIKRQRDQVLDSTKKYLGEKINTVFKSRSSINTLVKITRSIVPIAAIIAVVANIIGVGYLCFLHWLVVLKVLFLVGMTGVIIGLGWVLGSYIVIWVSCINLRISIPKSRLKWLDTLVFKFKKGWQYMIYWIKIVLSMFFSWKKEHCPGINWEN